MRKVIIFVALFMLLSVPAMAVSDTVDVEVTICVFVEFEITTAGPLTWNFDSFDDYVGWSDSRDLEYTLFCNTGWNVDGIIRDPSTTWNANWFVMVNGKTLNGTTALSVDSDTNPVGDNPGTYAVLIQIPWAHAPAAPSTVGCTIELTASAV